MFGPEEAIVAALAFFAFTAGAGGAMRYIARSEKSDIEAPSRLRKKGPPERALLLSYADWLRLVDLDVAPLQDLVARVVGVDTHPVVVDVLAGLTEVANVDPVVV